MDRDHVPGTWRDAVMRNLGYEEAPAKNSNEDEIQTGEKHHDHDVINGDNELVNTANKKQ